MCVGSECKFNLIYLVKFLVPKSDTKYKYVKLTAVNVGPNHENSFLPNKYFPQKYFVLLHFFSEYVRISLNCN